jgi:NMD protein affecting ribosome stability and mRNA decay
MSTRRGKPYTTSYKEKEHPKQDPYAMLRAPKGPAICPKCRAIYANKRWYFDEAEARNLAASTRTQKFVCPACQKIRDDYPEGIVTVKWSALRDYEAEIRGLIANVEARALSVNPLERVMKIVRRRKDLEVQTTNDRLAQRIGRELVRAYKGTVTYHWAHRDMLARVTWEGPEPRDKSDRRKKTAA